MISKDIYTYAQLVTELQGNTGDDLTCTIKNRIDFPRNAPELVTAISTKNVTLVGDGHQQGLAGLKHGMAADGGPDDRF